MNFSAVILAGGRSTRMGRDKAFLDWHGESLLARQIRIARAAGIQEIFISGRRGVDYSIFNLPVLHDSIEAAGPLAGIHSALLAASQPWVFVAAVDLPHLDAHAVRTLVDEAARRNSGIVTCCAGNWEPLASIYPKSAAERCGELLRRGTRSVREFALDCMERREAEIFEFPAEEQGSFTNLNELPTALRW